MTDDYEKVGDGWRDIDRQRKQKPWAPGVVILPLYRMRDLPPPFKPAEMDKPR